MRIVIVGGDVRFSHVYDLLTEAGADVCRVDGNLPDAHAALFGAEAVILPLPVTRDGVTLSGDFDPPLPLCELFAEVPPEAVILGGRINDAVRAAAGGRRVFDYEADPRFRATNAALSAEGAISLLMRESPSALFETPTLLLGSGQFASALASRLAGLSVPFSVFARRTEARLPGLAGAPLPLAALPAEIGRFSLLINTVPARILESSLLARCVKGSLLFELSCERRVVDAEAARAAGVRLLSVPGIPAKYAPASAGRAVYRAVDSILSSL